jgi:hypothetical protein
VGRAPVTYMRRLLIKYVKIINIMLTLYIQGPPTSTDHVSADEGIRLTAYRG